MTDEHPSRSTEAFFGRRKGKPLRERQADGLEKLLPRLKLDLANPAPPIWRSFTLSVFRRSGWKSASAVASI